MLLDEIKKIDYKLNSVNDLLRLGEMVRIAQDKISQVSGAVFHTIVDEPEYQMGIATFPRKGDATEEHRHPHIAQFVIQAKGKCAGSFDNGGYRILSVGECCALKPGEVHKFTALEDSSVQVWVCIPAEPGYKINSLD